MRNQYFNFLSLFVFFLFGVISLSATEYNSNGDFTLDLATQKVKVFNDNIDASFNFTILNNKNQVQSFLINYTKLKGWDILVNERVFSLNPGEEKQILVRFKANSNFDYSEDLVGPDVIKISQQSDYKGRFEFPFEIISDNDKFSLKFEVDIDKKEVEPIFFDIKLSNEKISPIKPLKYSIEGKNVVSEIKANVIVELGNFKLNDFETVFTPDLVFKIFQENVGNSFEPGVYNSKVIVRVRQEDGSILEWSDVESLVVERFENLVVNKNKNSNFFKDEFVFEIENLGNVDSNFSLKIEPSFLNRLFFSSNKDYLSEGGVYYFNFEVKKGEKQVLSYSYNYLFLYLILILIAVLISYIYVRKNSNPLDVETKIYEVKKVRHEGVKSLKVRIGFENIKEEEIDELKLIFRMPGYLNVKPDSFLLSEPNHALKGRNQFKLIWNFKKFEKNDSRILGFTLINSKGVLGDIRLPDLEIEVKIDGKVRKYYKSFPIVRG